MSQSLSGGLGLCSHLVTFSNQLKIAGLLLKRNIGHFWNHCTEINLFFLLIFASNSKKVFSLKAFAISKTCFSVKISRKFRKICHRWRFGSGLRHCDVMAFVDMSQSDHLLQSRQQGRNIFRSISKISINLERTEWELS